ncbi:MAG: TetR family transcriptional regulator [Polyangiaceae bacterium]
MATPSRLDVLRGAERVGAQRGIDALSLATVAAECGTTTATVASFFHDETTLLDAVLERHQTPYERRWEEIFDTIETPRDALRLLVRTMVEKVDDEDGGAAYVSIASQMTTSPRFTLAGRPATTTPTALRLIGKLTSHTALPFELIPVRFDRFAMVLFGSVASWSRLGAARSTRELFVEELVDCLAYMGLAAPTDDVRRRLES